MCLRLRRSMMTESASAVVIGGSPWGSVAGEGEEDVVEVGGVHGQLGGGGGVVGGGGGGPARSWGGAAGGDLQRERLLVGPAGPRDDLLGLGQRARVGEPEPDVPAGDHALELVGRALGDQRAVVKQRDPVGELVGLLQVLGGEEDRDA